MRPARLCGANFRKLSCREPHCHRRTNSDLPERWKKRLVLDAQRAHYGEIARVRAKSV
jgi:hypothetical protein